MFLELHVCTLALAGTCIHVRTICYYVLHIEWHIQAIPTNRVYGTSLWLSLVKNCGSYCLKIFNVVHVHARSKYSTSYNWVLL